MTRRFRLRALSAVAGLTVAASLLAGCTGYGNTALGANVLTISGDVGNPTLIENFNPYLLANGRLGGCLLIYETLVVQSGVDGKISPFLASGYTVVNSSTIRYQVRQGVRWTDGQPFTAADVGYTYNLIKKYPALDTFGVWSQLKSMTVSGNDVTFALKQPNVPYVGVLGSVPIVPQHIWASVKDPTKFENDHPVGTGPFQLDTFAPTQYVLKKNPYYWQKDKVTPDKVVFPAGSSNNSTTQLDIVSGKFDWAYSFLPEVKQTYVKRDPGTNKYWFPPGGAISLFLNLTKAPYTDVNFRRGISDSLNRPSIAQKAVNGYLGQASQSGLILPNLKKWLDPTIPASGNVSQNTGKALAEFSKAGYTMNKGKLVGKDGKQFQMTIVAPSGYSDWVAAAKEVSNQLATVGIKVTLDLPEATQYNQATQTGKFDAAFGGFGGTGVPYIDFNNALNSSFALPVGKLTVNNFERFTSKQVDSDLTALAAATSEADQQKYTRALEQTMYDQVPIVTLYYGGSWGIFSTRNYTGWPSATDPYTLPVTYNNTILLTVTHLKKAA